MQATTADEPQSKQAWSKHHHERLSWKDPLYDIQAGPDKTVNDV